MVWRRSGVSWDVHEGSVGEGRGKDAEVAPLCPGAVPQTDYDILKSSLKKEKEKKKNDRLLHTRSTMRFTTLKSYLLRDNGNKTTTKIQFPELDLERHF